MAPKVSVCLPVYNGERFLANAIESVSAQTYSDFELIIADDGSKDRSVEIIQSWQNRDNRIKFVRNESNLGLFKNYNRCLDLAQGEYIKTFAQDDLLHPECLSKMVDVLDNHPSVKLVTSMRILIDSNGESIKSQRAPSPEQVFPTNRVIAGNEVLQRCLDPLINYIGEPVAVGFRKECVGEGFDSRFHHVGDIEYWLRILLLGDCFVLPGVYSYFRCHDHSRSATNVQGMMTGLDILRFARKYERVLDGCGLGSEQFKKQAVNAMADNLRMLSDSNIVTEAQLESNNDFTKRLKKITNSECAEERDKLCRMLVEDLRDFRILAYHSLLLTSERNEQDTKHIDVLQNERVIQALEAEARLLMDSWSWRATKALRSINKMFSGCISRTLVRNTSSTPATSSSHEGAVECTINAAVTDENNTTSSSPAPAQSTPNNSIAANSPASSAFRTCAKRPPEDEVVASQNAYIEHLRSEIDLIKSSRSWKLAKVLRRFEKAMSV